MMQRQSAQQHAQPLLKVVSCCASLVVLVHSPCLAQPNSSRTTEPTKQVPRKSLTTQDAQSDLPSSTVAARSTFPSPQVSETTAAPTWVPPPQAPYPDRERPEAQLTATTNRLFFVIDTPKYGPELWTSDGTARGTRILSDLNPGPTGSAPTELFTSGSQVFFTARTDATGSELWTYTDTSGLRLLEDVNLGPSHTTPRSFCTQGNQLYFAANDAHRGAELRVIQEGTSASLLRKFRPILAHANVSSIKATDKAVFFVANDTIHGNELWTTDGTERGTTIVLDINPGWRSSNPRHLRAVGNRLYFTATDLDKGEELWVSEGTADETTCVLDLHSGIKSSSPQGMVQFGKSLAVTAVQTTRSLMLISIESYAVTPLNVLVAPFAPSREMVESHGRLFFVGNAVTSSGQLSNRETIWSTDGTTVGTRMLRSPAIKLPEDFKPRLLTATGNGIYFCTTETSGNYNLWIADLEAFDHIGSIQSTGSQRPWISGFAALRNDAYFIVYRGYSKELWVATPRNVRKVADL